MKMKNSTKRVESGDRGAFTIPELLVAMTILSMLLLMLATMIDQVQRAWTYSESRVSQFREARVAFDIVAKNLSQASLNSYWDYRYEKADGVDMPVAYKRTAELHFLVEEGSTLLGGSAPGQALFFQAPLGFSKKHPNLNNLLNGRGYFVYFGDDRKFKPHILPGDPKYRFRLMEFRPTSEENMIYDDSKSQREAGNRLTFSDWYKDGLDPGSGSSNSYPLAENIVALIVSPTDTIDSTGTDTMSRIAPSYKFDSSGHVRSEYRNQMPPLVRLTLVAIDETSAIRLENGATMPALIQAGWFGVSGNYNNDIEALRSSFSEQKISFKVFSSLVAIRGAKWSALSGEDDES